MKNYSTVLIVALGLGLLVACPKRKDPTIIDPPPGAEVAAGDRLLVALEAPANLTGAAHEGTAMGQFKLIVPGQPPLLFTAVSAEPGTGNLLLPADLKEFLFVSAPLTQPMIDAVMANGGATATISGDMGVTEAAGGGLDAVGADGDLATTYGLWQEKRGGAILPLGAVNQSRFKIGTPP